ncbi:type II toxin-antitoxin system VapC family toxin [Shinella zoogloeoides]|uniref:PIN domain-containing protein n=1 Tax=Shinella zoogloeoides TaxID=352475 RepID=A0A6N8TGG1_SHIZO|nr:type II toxin-antitoxin system VapC family toxin [Shinella zoogloeoides]MXO00210.1 PIN domain-containing protein [Shinella zoogloeoides]UEX82535.1 type II toxin-antitoxin system VapC family toxin [Shinella zoogloeoides]
MFLVDTNVLLDLVTGDPVWADWSVAALEGAALLGPLAINDVVYAELSVRYRDIADLDAMVAAAELAHLPMPKEALFLAGKAFQAYRRAGGGRTGVLPDFFIGAHAAVAGWTLITRDAGRYRAYFPGLALRTPERSDNPGG